MITTQCTPVFFFWKDECVKDVSGDCEEEKAADGQLDMFVAEWVSRANPSELLTGHPLSI